MTLLSLTTSSFRNLDGERLELHPRLSLLVGDNGQGKTNLLEAMVLVSGRSSFRTAELDEVRAPDAGVATATAVLPGGIALAVSLRAGTREHVLSGRRVSRLQASRELPLVSLTSSDLGRLAGLPAARRRALDRLAAALDPSHARALSRFEKARATRARLLSRQSRDPDEQAVYDETFCAAGGVVAAGRRRACRALSSELALQAGRLRSPFQALRLELKSDLPDEGDAAALGGALTALLASKASDERRAGRCLVGPHRDDLVLTSEGVPVAARASSGESRTLVLAWSLAELALTQLGRSPVFVFDDFDSEWDPRVLSAFSEALPGDVQVVLTSARPEAVEGLGFPDGVLYRVASGGVRALRSLSTPRLVRSA